MAATGIYRAIRLDWTNPDTATFANTELLVATTNDRSLAVRLAAPEGIRNVAQSYTHSGLTPGDVRYYWRRPRNFDGTFDAYDPVSPTGGWTATALNLPTEDIRLTWTEVTGTTQQMVSQNGYIANNAALVTLTLPTTAKLGEVIEIVGKGAGGWTIAQNASQSIVSGDVSTTVGVGGSYPSVLRYDSVILRCITANTTWSLEALTTDVGIVWHGLVPKAPNDTAKFLRGDATWAVPTVNVPWTVVTGTSQAMTTNNGYITNNAALVTVTLPTTAAVGDVLYVLGLGAGKWRIAQNASQNIRVGSATTTTGTGGSITAPTQYTGVELRCIVANTTWEVLGDPGVLIPETHVVTLPLSDPNGNALTTGDLKNYFRVPSTMTGTNLIAVAAHVSTVSSSGAITVQVRNVTDAVDMLSTAITIDVSEKDTLTAATPAVINAATDDVATGDEIAGDVDGAGTGAKGLELELHFQLPAWII